MRFPVGTRVRKVKANGGFIPEGAVAVVVVPRKRFKRTENLSVETETGYQDVLGMSRTYWHTQAQNWEPIQDSEEKGSWEEIEKATGWKWSVPAGAS